MPYGSSMTAGEGSEPVDELLAAAYALDGPDSSRALYARWAATYDSGFIVESQYRYHEQVAAVFAAHCLAVVGVDEAVVDIGCGTGLGGAALRCHGAATIDGIDISPEMLQQAAMKLHGGKPVYRTLVEADLTRPLAVADGSYAGALSVGTFTHGHVGPEALAGVLRIIRPGGRAAFGINAAHFATAGFGPVLDRLGHSGTICDLRLVDVPIYDGADMADPDQYAHVAVLTVT
jgi:predicted TPR repeat methyltransferase